MDGLQQAEKAFTEKFIRISVASGEYGLLLRITGADQNEGGSKQGQKSRLEEIMKMYSVFIFRSAFV